MYLQKEPKIKRKKVCRYCSIVFFKPDKESQTQWAARRFCSPVCAGSSKRKHKDAKAKDLYHRRKNGALEQGTPEFLERISKTTKLAMQRPEVQEKIRQPRGALSLERRMQISDNLKGKMPKNMIYPNQGRFPNVQRGYYDINGTTIYFRSKWEANYALYLDFLIDHKQIHKWEFEPDTFMFEAIKLGTRSYTPDFKVFITPEQFEYHEVKGYMDSKSKTKLKRFAKYYPDEKLILIDKDEYNLLKKQIGKICQFY